MLLFRAVALSVFVLIPLEVLGWNPKEECPNVPEDPVKAQIAAGNLFSEAEADYQASRPLKALKGFLCSHRIMPHENTLFNIVQISKLTEHQENSVEILKDFVRNEEASHKVEPIEEVIAELERRIIAKKGEDVTLPSEESSVAEKESADDADKTASDGTTEPVAQSRRKRKMKIAGLSLTGAGAGVLLAGGVFQLIAQKSQRNATETQSYATFEDERDNMKRFQKVAIVSFVSGGVLVGTGMVLWLLSRKSESLQSSSFAFLPTVQGVFLTGRF